MGRTGGRDEENPVKVEHFPDLLGTAQMADVNRIKGSAEEPPFHVLTCPFP